MEVVQLDFDKSGTETKCEDTLTANHSLFHRKQICQLKLETYICKLTLTETFKMLLLGKRRIGRFDLRTEHFRPKRTKEDRAATLLMMFLIMSQSEALSRRNSGHWDRNVHL